MTPREHLLARAVAWFGEHGVGDTSLRTLAAGIGTSHRMLNYHFGSRAGLLGAVVETVERGEQDALRELAATHDDPFEAGALFWTRVADRAEVFAPLFFELSTHAMRREPHAEPLRRWLGVGWGEALREVYEGLGLPAGPGLDPGAPVTRDGPWPALRGGGHRRPSGRGHGDGPLDRDGPQGARGGGPSLVGPARLGEASAQKVSPVIRS